MKAILNTGRTIHQGMEVEHKASPGYRAAVSVCYMNPLDLMDLGIEQGARVTLTSRSGRIVLITRATEMVNQGEVFVPLGPYANHLISAQTHATGMPDFKGEPVDVIPTDEQVKDIDDVMEEMGGVRHDH
jgi:formylmethanofuran dehydrogenase subunit D